MSGQINFKLPLDDGDVDSDGEMAKMKLDDMDTALIDVDTEELMESLAEPGKRMALITRRGRAERRVLGCL